MRRALKFLAWTLGVLLALPVLLVAAVLIGLNTGAGQRALAARIGPLTGGMVALTDLSGSIPASPRIGRVQISDAQGVWLTIDDVALDWSPLALLGMDARIDRLSAGRIALPRLPASAPATQPAPVPVKPFSLPVRVDVAALHVARIELGPELAGVAAALAIDGTAHVASVSAGTADIAVTRLDGGGTYKLDATIDDTRLAARLDAQEPPHGLAATLATLPDLGALSLQASIDGPWNAAGTTLSLTAGPLVATAKGTVDVTGQAADLTVSAHAPAMTPRPDVSWQEVALDAHVQGAFTSPNATGTLRIAALNAGGAALRVLTADISGNAGRVGLHAGIDGLRLPGPAPALLEAAPMTLQADARLDAPDRPVTFALVHPLISVTGSAHTGGDISADIRLDLPNLAPFAAIGGVDVQGHTTLAIKAAMANGETVLDVDGPVVITGGMAPLVGLIGPEGRIGVSARLHGSDVAVSRAMIDGRKVSATAQGGLTGGAIGLDWTLALADLKAAVPMLEGKIAAHGHVAGPTGNFAAQLALDGTLGTTGFPRGPVTLAASATGLPALPAGEVTAAGQFDGAPLTLKTSATRTADGTLAVRLDRAGWKSAEAEGAATLAPGASLPVGKLSLKMARLDDLRPLLGQPVAGSIAATAQLGEEAGRETARVQIDAKGAGLPGTAQVGALSLAARVLNPSTKPDVQAKLALQGLQASGIGGTVTLDAAGLQDALALTLAADLQNVGGAGLTLASAATLNATARQLALAKLQAVWKGETLRLLSPAKLSFADGVAVDRLRLGLRQAVLDVAGRATPTLDLTASLRNVTADLAEIVAPDVKASGTLTADARLTGTAAAPRGTVHLAATALHMRTGPAAGLPPAALTADAVLAGASARIDTKLAAGRSQLRVSGTAPLAAAGALDLRAAGAVDLALLNPILSAQGQRVTGQATIDAGVAGTIAAPRASGSLRLTDGEIQDFAQGARLDAITALIEAQGDTIRITRFTARAGQGTLALTGSVGLAAPMPIDLSLTADHASPLASDKLTVVLDMALTLRGDIQGALAAAGRIKIDRADIRVPESMPVSVAVLNVRRPGDKPPPPSTKGPDIALNLLLDAPAQMFVRGRGLDAELQGRLRVGGTAAAPQPSGKFELRYGTFSLAGQSLTFTTGEVGFDGSGKLDPTLNFIASSSNATVTATLTVTGYASAPKIALSSVPQLPQDEVLAQLLFHQSASSLSPLQLAQIAAALAQISGIGGAGSFDPLNSVRQGLGLDRLSVDGGSGPGSTPSVSGGRYVRPGVFVGAKQSTSGAGTQAMVQFDITRGLKLETDVGTGGGASGGTNTGAAADPGGTSVGLTYQFEY